MMVNTLGTSRTGIRIFRFAIVVVTSICAFVLLTILFSHADLLIWRTEVNGLIGHPLADVLAMKREDVGVTIARNENDLYAIRRKFHPSTAILPRGRVVVAYRHVPPGMWAALIFLDEQDNVFAVHVAGYDSR